MDVKKEVSRFWKKYGIKKSTVEFLESTLSKQGYTIVRFNGVEDSEEVLDIINALNVADYIASCRCFTYRDKNYRLIFLNEKLNDEETLIVLSHEEGHIWLDHISDENIIGNDVMQEYQANEFAHYLLKGAVSKNKLVIMLCLIALLSFVIGGILLQNNNNKIYTENYYRTETGQKYHVLGCMYIRDKKTVHRLTKDEYDSGLYEPCGACLPDLY